MGALCIAPAAAFAQADVAFDGLWRPSPTAACEYTGADGGALKIEDDVLYGVENRCTMTRPVNVRDMAAVLYDMECTGEGTEFTGRAMFMTAADGGLILVWDGFAYKYDACEGDPVIGTVTTSEEIGITE